MPKQNRQPGIHLHKTKGRVASIKSYMETKDLYEDQWYWILIARNGKTTARSSKTYKRKRSAVRSIEVAAEIFENKGFFYDHTAGGVGVDEIYY